MRKFATLFISIKNIFKYYNVRLASYVSEKIKIISFNKLSLNLKN
jgi:hypothetical protein